MIVGNENIFCWMRLNGNPYWTLRDQKGDKSRPIAESEKTPSMGIEESITRLKQVFAMKGNRGQYYIITRPSSDFNSTRDIYQDYVELGDTTTNAAPQIGGFPASNGNHLTKEDLMEEIKKARTDWEREQQIKRLEDELKELKKEKPTSMESFIGRIEPYMPQILGALFQKNQVGITGFNSPKQSKSIKTEVMPKSHIENNEASLLQNNNERLQTALEKLDGVLSAEGIDIIEVLEKLAEKAEENPAKIKMAITMIL